MGPIGMYALQGMLTTDIRTAIFEAFELVQLLRAKTQSSDSIKHIETTVPRVLSALEYHFPLYFNSINTHLFHHSPRARSSCVMFQFLSVCRIA
jgi:hypothetical protein